jgi:hypothetical protein
MLLPILIRVFSGMLTGLCFGFAQAMHGYEPYTFLLTISAVLAVLLLTAVINDLLDLTGVS